MSSSSSSNPTNPQSQSQEQPSLLSGHAEYIKGSAESAIGSITGSHAWTTSGEQDKAHAKANLKAAAEARDSEGKGYGHVEEVAGKWTGCEGMKEEGKISAERAKRRD
ncbi:hypothetical protein V8F20_002452 [Naviculisporaceae sp. PSN 640]